MSRNIIAAVDDLIFAAKIKATAENVGAAVRFAKSLPSALELAQAQPPDAVLVDLHAQKCAPVALAETFKGDAALRDIPLVGFFSHVHTALMREAQAAGYDRVLPRSAFVKQLPDILRGTE